jgi:hypothetical protein
MLKAREHALSEEVGSMLNYTDFWPALWLTIGAGLVVTAALCLLVATFSPDWFRPRRHHHGTVTPVKPAAHGHQDRREPKAA